MSNGNLPSYLTSATPNPKENRAPWYKNTAPAYAGIFLSVPFMAGMAGALVAGSLTAAIIGLFMGAMFCLVLYYVPGKLGMKTGMPLYVVASSTFGTHGGILIPGLLMGVVQIFWHAFFTTSAAGFFMEAIGKGAPVNELAKMPLYWGVCAVLGLALAFVGAVGIGLLSKLSSFLPIFPLVAIAVAAVVNSKGLGNFSEAVSSTNGVLAPASAAMFAALAATAGFFASAGVAGTDFGMNSRNEKDVALGGFFGITCVALVAGVLAIVAIAGAIGTNPEIAGMKGFDPFIAAINQPGGIMATLSSWVFVIACICPLGFCAFLAANAFSTMMPKIPRIPMTMVAGAIGVVLAATGKASDLVGFFVMVGAAFGPIAGVMLADYVRHGGWAGPRKGINLAGYIAWAIGLVMGLLGPLSGGDLGYGIEPLIALVVAAAAYFILAGMGLEPETVELESAKKA
ncbi:MAG: cytosine permease [Phycisphaerae bacterium]|nr:cytosine permease [Phycisphaerae bacterium]